jgi:hypothetical protein
MIPARRTGKPLWQLYLCNDPPIWEAYIECAKHFDIDSLMDGYAPLLFPEERQQEHDWQQFVVARSGTRITTQDSCLEHGRRTWAGGRFILSTGDQCGRDTPDENLHALVETARTYGRY